MRILIYFNIFFTFIFCNCLHAQTQADSAIRNGFSVSTYANGFNNPMAMKFTDNGDLFVCQKNGKLLFYNKNKKSNEVVIDISEEVANYGDHGLMSFALDKHFLSNGYVYLMYAVDRHYLEHFGTSQYDPEKTKENEPTIARITRFTLENNSQNATENDKYYFVEGSRKILLGDKLSNGMPITFISHGAGSINMGQDGTLLASMGDGASIDEIDTGGVKEGSWTPQALDEGWIPPKYDIGSLRAQLIDCLNGKIIRIDAETGEGLPSNPFYDPNAPNAPRSKVWTLGLRSPFRFCIKPGTGSHNPEDGNPGTIFVGDVGRYWWEEVTIVNNGGENLGWPLYEGYHKLEPYYNSNKYNLDAPNSYYGQSYCEREYFYFRDLLIEEVPDAENADTTHPNPCNPTKNIENEHVFMHNRPVFDYYHNINGASRYGAFSGDKAGALVVKSHDFNGDKHQFGGLCIVGGTWYDENNFPEKFQDTYFFADFDMGWIKALSLNENNEIANIYDISNEPATKHVVQMRVNHENGRLYYIDYHGSSIKEIGYNVLKPEPVINIDKKYGDSPLTVTFDASETKNPGNTDIKYVWEFDNNTNTDTGKVVEHTFQSNEIKVFNVKLKVFNQKGDTASTSKKISVNNTPPNVEIIQPIDSTLYPITHTSEYKLKADVSDKEQTNNNLEYNWVVSLHHNQHFHPEPVDHSKTSNATVSPLGCRSDSYFYSIKLTIDDGKGLTSSDEIKIYPNCENASPKVQSEYDTLQENYSLNDDMTLKLPDSLFYDKEDGYDLKWNVTLNNDEELPVWADFDSSNKEISIDYSSIQDTNLYKFKIYAEDNQGARAFKYVTIQPKNLNNIANEDYYNLIDIFPNPANNKLFIDIHEKDTNVYNLKLVDNLGKKVIYNSRKVSYQSNVLDVGFLVPGVYHIILANSEDKTVKKFTFIKN